MIGRNEPCLCGSGKKYKKCCLRKNEETVEQLVADELNRIVHSMYEQPQDHSDIAEYEKYYRQWTGKLGNLWDKDSVESSVSEYFFFVARCDLWNRHLVKVLNSPVRSAVRSVIEKWRAPFILFGNVKDVKNGFIEVKEILGNNTFYLEKEEGMPAADKNSIVFGVVLHDNRNHENGVFVISSLMFVKDSNGKFVNEITNLAESSGIENSLDFYKEHMVDIYRIMLNEETGSIEDLIESDLTQIQQEALEILEERLEDIRVNEETHELLTNIMVTYFLKEQPNFRKPNIIAAALFRVAIDMEMLGEYSMTNVEVSKLFDVSTSSITKHAETIGSFVVDMLEEMGMEERQGPSSRQA